jgi:hypothetical protein
MSLYIRHTDNEAGKVCETEWTLPNPPPAIQPGKVVEIQAQGLELDVTLNMFGGMLNKSRKPYTMWEGPLARLVYREIIETLGTEK